MYHNYLPVIRNYKIHFKLQHILTLDHFHHVKNVQYHGVRNFVILQTHGFTFIPFLNTTHVNVTGITQKEDIERSIKLFARRCKLHRQVISHIRIDNITASGKFFISFPLHALAQNVWHRHINITYNMEIFPAVIIRVAKQNKKIGTMLLFQSGKFTIVGTNTPKKVRQVHGIVKALVSSVNKTFRNNA